MTVGRTLLWVVAASLAACSDASPGRAPFAVSHTSPALDAVAAPLLLNDAVTVYFTADVQPVSVTANSVTMVDEQGQAVPGTLRVGSNWVSFQPLPPVTPELADGSFRPGAAYQLLVAGAPRPDAVRSLDGRRLAAATAFPVRIAGAADRPAGLVAPLRPATNGIPFVLRPHDQVAQPLPADAPRLWLYFTQPLLPASVTPAAFQIHVLGTRGLERLVPRLVRILPPRLQSPRLEAPLGSIVEIDLGALPQRADGASALPLLPGNHVYLQLRDAAASVRDYLGQPPWPSEALTWVVVEGASLPIAEWPTAQDEVAAEEDLLPTFERDPAGGLRARVRVEAGDGSLGVFRPRVDTTLRPGQPFDRGDGQVVVSRGGQFPFLAIDIPANVTVRVEADGAPVQLLASGSVRIAGTLQLQATPVRLPPGRATTMLLRDLVSQVPVAVVAAGSIDVAGHVRARDAATDDKTNLLLASAAGIDLRGGGAELPFQTLLAVEQSQPGGGSAIRGARGQTVLYMVAFTPGVAAGADFAVAGLLPWRQLPLDRDSAVLHLAEASPDLEVAWQIAPGDPVRRGPDLGVGRVTRLQSVADRDTVAFAAGSYLRLRLVARVAPGRELPRVRELRLADR